MLQLLCNMFVWQVRSKGKAKQLLQASDALAQQEPPLQPHCECRFAPLYRLQRVSCPWQGAQSPDLHLAETAQDTASWHNQSIFTWFLRSLLPEALEEVVKLQHCSLCGPPFVNSRLRVRSPCNAVN